jgi:tellurite resistance protein TehA-like permease
MATGIVSLAGHLAGLRAVSLALFALNIVFYAVLSAMTAFRLARYWPQVRADLLDHQRCVGFFTLVAATCVLGSQFVVLARRPAIAAVLWLVGIGLWALLTYTVFTALTVKEQKPPLSAGINGGWLVSVVATQAVSVLGTQLALHFAPRTELVLFVTLVFWLGGGMLYIWIISLIFYRYTFFRLEPSDLSPPYWINMGAMAISTLAGTMLLMALPNSALLQDIAAFVKGGTLLFWATATWWIPMLVILGFWRHVYSRYPLRYDSQYWGAVFPLGMYTACTFRLCDALHLPTISIVPKVFVWIALLAWLAAAIGLARSLASALRRDRTA